MSHDLDFEAWIDEARGLDIVKALDLVGGAHKISRKTRYVGPCPGCGGVDRFSINVRKNIFWCRKAGLGGDAIALAAHVQGSDFMGAVEMLTGRPPPGRAVSDAEREARDRRIAEIREQRRAETDRAEREMNDFRSKEIRRAHDIWRAAGPMAGSIAESYLRYRGVNPAQGAKLRSLTGLPYWHFVAGTWKIIHEGPAMIAAIQGRDGGFIGCHCTWIDAGFSTRSGKASIIHPETGELLDAKKVRGSQKGGHIHLAGAATAKRLVAGEGIETVYSVREAEAETVRSRTLYWSSVNLGNLGGRAVQSVVHPTATMKDKAGRIRRCRVPGPVPDIEDSDTLQPPPDVEDVVLLGDGDSDRFATRNTLLRFAARWQRPGMTVRAAWAEDGADFNDMLRGSVA